MHCTIADDTANFVFVDEDGDEITVYDEGGHYHASLQVPGPTARRQVRLIAERLAEVAAQDLGCDWGTNY